jgi:hypothetical protein
VHYMRFMAEVGEASAADRALGVADRSLPGVQPSV